MRKIWDFFEKTSRRSTAYFRDYKEEIAQNNLAILKKASLFVTIVLCIYAIWAYMTFKNEMLVQCYLIFIVLSSAFTLIVWRFGTFWGNSPSVVNRMCMLLIAIVMSFMISVSIFPFPNDPSIFFPVFYILMTAIFIFPYWKSNFYMGLFVVIFIVLVRRYKDPVSYPYDLSAAVTGWLMGLLLSFLVLDLRLRENDLRRKLESFSYLDQITGLPNRRAFEINTGRIYEECREQGLPVAIFMLDIDHFKQYNDGYGHLAGDSCLARIGAALKAEFAEDELFVARYGGEEFVCVAYGKEAECAQCFAERMMYCVKQYGIVFNHSKTGYLTISIGVSYEGKAQEKTYTSLLHRADTALYFAKEHGRNRIVFYDENMGLK